MRWSRHDRMWRGETAVLPRKACRVFRATASQFVTDKSTIVTSIVNESQDSSRSRRPARQRPFWDGVAELRAVDGDDGGGDAGGATRGGPRVQAAAHYRFGDGAARVYGAMAFQGVQWLSAGRRHTNSWSTAAVSVPCTLIGCLESHLRDCRFLHFLPFVSGQFVQWKR
eukprot:6205188-Pleurochrysis_carterae.AAC.1